MKRTCFEIVTDVIVGFCGASSVALLVALSSGWPKNKEKQK